MSAILPGTQGAAEASFANPGPVARRVLVVSGGRLGEFMTVLGALKTIRRFHPRARIILLTDPVYAGFAAKCPFVDAVLEPGALPGPREQKELASRIAEERFDIVYELNAEGRDAALAAALRQVKPRPLWSRPHDDAGPHGLSLDTPSRLSRQLQAAGLPPVQGVDLSWVRAANGDPPRLKPAYFGLQGPYALLVPGSAPERAKERWPAQSFGKLARAALESGVTPVLIGSAAEADLVPVILRECREAVNLVTRTDLFQLICLAEGALFAVGNASGPLTVALLVRRPAIAICQANSTARLPPWPEQDNVVRLHAEDVSRIPLERLEASGTGVLDLIKAIGGISTLPKSV